MPVERINLFWNWLKTKKYYIFGFAALLLLAIISVFIETSKPIKVIAPLLAPTLSETSQSNLKLLLPPPTYSLPQTVFKSYENKSLFPSVPQTINSYTLKTNYSLAEILAFGQKFGFTESKTQDDNFVILYNLADIEKRGMLTFNKQTGEYFFESWGTHKAEATETSPVAAASGFLSKLGLQDGTISCPITYQRKGLGNITYVECHRDWNLVGLPILNFFGVLNIPETKLLSSLSLGEADENYPDDASVINVSTGQNGKVRPNDFNTITVAVSSEGNIVSIDSKMRQIIATKTYSRTDILSPQEAFDLFSAGRAELSLVIPSGTGSLDWEKIYPSNLALAEKATVTDFVLTYLENPLSVKQNNLVPMYTIRGIAQLNSGYLSGFTQTLPALRTGLSFLPAQATGQVAAASTEESPKTLKLGTMASPSPLPSSSSPIPTSSSSPLLPPQCRMSEEFTSIQERVIFETPGIGKLSVLFSKEIRGPVEPHTFWFESASSPVSGIGEVREEFFKIVGDQFVINVARAIKRNPSLISSAPTQTEIYDLFKKVNGSQGSCLAVNIIAPLLNCRGSPGEIAYFSNNVNTFTVDEENMGKVYENTAKKILELVGQNKIDEWAERQDLFPTTTLKNFSWVFWKMTNGLVASLRQTGHSLPMDCYITGVSPSLYFYPQKATKVSVKINLPWIYSDPSISNNSWEGFANPNGLVKIQNYQPRSRLYYEYNPKVTFSEPQEGFVVPKENWEEFINENLSQVLGLKQNEKEDLFADFKNVLRDLKESPYLKISIVNSQEIEEKLPLIITPKPDKLYRIHLLITPLSEKINLPFPQIEPVSRDGFIALELGVTSN